MGDQMQADTTISEVRAKGGNAIAVQGDIGKTEDVDKLFSATVDAFDRMMTTNVRGTFLVLAKAAEVLGSGGRIVALSTSVIAKATPGYGPYIASKAAVEGLVHVLANELRGRNITVNAVAPGPVATELFMNGKTEEQMPRWRRWRPSSAWASQ